MTLPQLLVVVLIPVMIGIWGLQRHSDDQDAQIQQTQIWFCQALISVRPALDEKTRNRINRLIDKANCDMLIRR